MAEPLRRQTRHNGWPLISFSALNPATAHSRRNGILLILLAALLWSTGGIGIKGVPDAALKVTFYRSLVAAIVLAALFRPRFRWTATFLIAIVSYVGCLTSFVIATKLTTAANAIFLQYAGVIWVLLLSPLVLGERRRRQDVIAIVMAMAGMSLFFVQQFEARGMTGNGMALLSSLFFATLILALRRDRGGAAEAAVTYGNVLTALVMLPFVSSDLGLTTRSAVILVLLGVFQIAIAYALFVRGLNHVTATQASLTGMVEPIANPVWVFLFLGERPSVFSVIGGAIVLAAIGWRSWTTSGAEPVVPGPD